MGTFYNQVPVIEYLKSQIKRREELPPGISLSEEQRKDTEKALRGLKIEVTHRTGCSQKYTIRGLTQDNSRNIKFNMRNDNINEGQRTVTIETYFKAKYRRDIKYKELPCLDLGHNRYVPMEFCKLCEGQRVPRDKIDKNSNLYGRTPRTRRQNIVNYVKGNDGPTKGNFVKEFELEVDGSMAEVTGRVLKTPKVTLKDRPPKDRTPNDHKPKDKEVDLDQKNPRWNFSNNCVFDGKPIENWCVMNFATSKQQDRKIGEFTSALVSRCGELGIQMNKEPLQQTEFYTMDDFNNVTFLQQKLSEVLKKANKENPIVICVMKYKHPGYHTLKRIAETKIGLVTQCCLYNNITKQRSSQLSQLLANLALKMNAKMGGSNSACQLPRLGNSDDHRVMYMGADVNHPNPGDNDSPSVAAVVGSVNSPDCNRYIAKIRYQTRRKEQIEQLKDMSKELLDDYRNNNQKRLPDSILYFRDGVSEGQFDMVLTQELSALKAAADKFDNYKPQISIIVAQKRHHTRLFRQNPSEENTNISAGTVVDTDIVHPHQFDFYLCSHHSAIGTSRPTHYHVLMDENKFTSDKLQRLINNLCYTYQRCTSPVSLVPPVYYADLAAYRGRCYLYGLSFTSSSPPNYPTLHDQVKKTMFFC